MYVQGRNVSPVSASISTFYLPCQNGSIAYRRSEHRVRSVLRFFRAGRGSDLSDSHDGSFDEAKATNLLSELQRMSDTHP